MAAAARQLDAAAPAELAARGGGTLIFRLETRPGDILAIKVPDFPHLVPGREAIARGRLAREAKVLAAVTSGHVPRLVACDEDAGFLAREWVAGDTLTALITSRELGQQQRMDMCAAVLEGAADLFRAFHRSDYGAYAIRDFKPRNLIRRAPDGRMVLVDLGGVRSARNMLSRRTGGHRPGAGKWRYWPPEQLLEQAEDLDFRVDYFALGSTLYAIGFGRAPYTNQSPAIRLEADYRRRHAAITRRLASASCVPPALAAYILACLAPDPAQRPGHVPLPGDLI